MKEKSSAFRLTMPLFAVATLLPAALMLCGVFFGGGWVWLGFLYMGGLALVLDQVIPLVPADAEDGAEFPASDAILVAVGLGHLMLLPATVWEISAGADLSPLTRGLLFLAAGYWFGQVAHPAAHELIHRPGRGLFWLGGAIYTTLLMGHHTSAHRLVHHIHVATDKDPNSAPAGMGFWTFAPRAWVGSFRAGWSAESRLSQGRKRVHPYLIYLAGAVLSLALGYGLGGMAGVAVWLGLGLHATLQILLADYIQHYGLRRALRPDGKAEPVRTEHSWNTPHWFSQAMMLNAPRHSDHHAHPARPYPALRLPQDAPLLPWPLPVAGAVAMVPRLWKRRMKTRLARVQSTAQPTESAALPKAD